MLKQVAFLGNRDAFVDCPKSWRTRSIRSAASDRSRIVNDGLRPIWVAYSLSNRAPIAWNVPDHGRSTCWVPMTFAVIRLTRRIISSAARRVDVNSKSSPRVTRPTRTWGTRAAQIFAFPLRARPVTRGARAGASYHQERRSFRRRFGTYAMLYGAALLLVQISQIVRGHDCQPLLIRSSTS